MLSVFANVNRVRVFVEVRAPANQNIIRAAVHIPIFVSVVEVEPNHKLIWLDDVRMTAKFSKIRICNKRTRHDLCSFWIFVLMSYIFNN